MKRGFSRQIFEKYSDIKFSENPSSVSRVMPSDRRTDMTKLIVAFRNLAYAPKKCYKNRRSHWPRGISRGSAVIVGSNPAEGMDVCLVIVVCCQVEVSASG
jgi:hypothetical protein